MDTLESELDRYHLALGTFITTFASTQRLLFAFLGTTSGAPVDFARILFGEIGVQGAMEKILQVMRLRSCPEQEISEIQRCFSQLRFINEARNLIVHHGIETDDPNIVPGPEGFIVSNRFSAIDQRRIKSFPVSGKIIKCMTNDVSQIGIIIVIISTKYDGHPIETTVSEVKSDWEWTPNFSFSPAR